MALNYNKLWKMLIDKNMSKSELVKRSKISTNAMARMGKNEDPGENDPYLPEEIRGQHFDSWTDLAKVLGYGE